MTFSKLQTQILTGAVAALNYWLTAEPFAWTDVLAKRGEGRREREWHNASIAAAVERRQIQVAAEKWLGRPLTPSDAASFSRAVKTLEAKGLIVRVSDSLVRGASRHTRHIRFTEAGEKIAAELLSQLTESAEAGSTPAATVATSATAATGTKPTKPAA
jgi:hypothetical protein